MLSFELPDDHWRTLQMTGKQYATIETIQAYTRHTFHGENRGDAYDFIGAHIAESITSAKDLQARLDWSREDEEDLEELEPYCYITEEEARCGR